VDEQEDEDADEEQRRDEAQQALGDVLEHAISESDSSRKIEPDPFTRRYRYLRSISVKLNEPSGIV
jgi:hypothetical protein